jgi:mRNA-degrading endonuclease RelE of RelBE toxin-antitoxin system
MAFRLSITQEAAAHLRALPARDQRVVQDAILARLSDQPTPPTRAIKRLRPNPLVEFEPRVGEFRVLYNVEADEVVILVIGRKAGNVLIVGGEEFHGHESDPAERA